MTKKIKEIVTRFCCGCGRYYRTYSNRIDDGYCGQCDMYDAGCSGD